MLLLEFKMDNQPYNPLHGLTLKTIVTDLEAYFGFETLGKTIKIKCFTDDPSIQSTLKFLRKTPWAREKVDQLYIKNKTKIQKSFE
jgi:uncharacterized protein (DUF2132 family)